MGDLTTALYGLLMLLPQSEAFKIVKNRLACVPHTQRGERARENNKKNKRKKYFDEIDFPSLLDHFQEVVSWHQVARRKEKTQQMTAREVNNVVREVHSVVREVHNVNI